MFSYIIIFFLQLAAYYFAKLINVDRQHYDFTLGFDKKIPFQMIWIYPYVLAYLWWFMTPLIVARYTSDRKYKEFLITLGIVYVVSFLIFIIVPTTIARPTVEVKNVTSFATNFIFESDVPNNLLPSMHCSISLVCYMVLRREKRVPKKLFYAQFVMAILVCISTQMIKQHYIVDFLAAFILAEVVYYVVVKGSLYRLFGNLTLSYPIDIS